MGLEFDRWRGQVAVVTGASAGIGAAIAETLVAEGLKVVGVARRVERVEELAKKLSGKKGKLYAHKADMTKDQEVINIFEWTTKNVGPVSILVNNAGIAQQTSLVDGDIEKWRKVIDTNVVGLSIATREAIKIMQKNNIDGHIIHINSVAGHKIPNFPGLNVYPATKHAVTALTETLRLELNALKSKIRITSISSGAVRTEIMEINNLVLDEAAQKIVAQIPFLESQDIVDAVFYVLATPQKSISPGAVKTEIAETNGMAADEGIKKLMAEIPYLESQDIADAVFYVLATPQRVQIHEMIIKPNQEPF